METEILIALIGSFTSICVAWIGSRSNSSNSIVTKKPSFLIILAVGLAITGIAISLASLFESQTPQLAISKTTIAAYTPGSDPMQPDQRFEVPRVHDPALTTELDLRCPSKYYPLVAWHEVIGSHPAETMYTINPNVVDGKVFITLRGRENARGYAYVEVFLLCTRLHSG